MMLLKTCLVEEIKDLYSVMNNDKNKFLNLAANQKKAFIPYVVANFPNQDVFTETLYTLKDLGADLIEVGIPFSDPIAEGKIIESAHHQVLNDNFNLVSALEVIKNFKIRF